MVKEKIVTTKIITFSIGKLSVKANVTDGELANVVFYHTKSGIGGGSGLWIHNTKGLESLYECVDTLKAILETATHT